MRRTVRFCISANSPEMLPQGVPPGLTVSAGSPDNASFPRTIPAGSGRYALNPHTSHPRR